MLIWSALIGHSIISSQSECLKMNEGSDQCDQMWRNFAASAKNKVFGSFLRVYLSFCKM